MSKPHTHHDGNFKQQTKSSGDHGLKPKEPSGHDDEEVPSDTNNQDMVRDGISENMLEHDEYYLTQPLKWRNNEQQQEMLEQASGSPLKRDCGDTYVDLEIPSPRAD